MVCSISPSFGRLLHSFITSSLHSLIIYSATWRCNLSNIAMHVLPVNTYHEVCDEGRHYIGHNLNW